MSRKQPTYKDKLEDDEWVEMKRRILRRDGHSCQICLSKVPLNVHHRYYIHGVEPWNYPENALVSLCERCHKLVHETLPPLVYAEYADEFVLMKYTPCRRCSGYGYLPEYRYVQNGLCFRCKGEKYEELINGDNNVNEHIDRDAEIFDSPESCSEMDKLFIKGKKYDDINPGKAKQFYRKAAIHGHGKAQNNLGLLCEEAGDLISARRWLLYGAMQGIDKAISNLGFLLRENDYKTYLKWQPILEENRHFVYALSVEIFEKYLCQEEDKPSKKDFISSLSVLMKLSSEGYEDAEEFVIKYSIRELRRLLGKR